MSNGTTIKQVETPIYPVPEKPEAKPSQGPQLVMEPVPCFSPLVNMVWPTIKTIVEELARESYGEFESFDVFKEIYFGSAFLYMGYMVEDKERYDRGEEVKKTFVGYAIVKLDKSSAHIWQVYIVPEYRATNVFEIGYLWIEAEMKKVGARYMSLSAQRALWGSACQKLGYNETFTIFRKKL